MRLSTETESSEPPIVDAAVFAANAQLVLARAVALGANHTGGEHVLAGVGHRDVLELFGAKRRGVGFVVAR